MNISVEDLFPESFQRIKEEEEANRPDPNWFAHLPPEKSMRICPSTLSNPLMIFLWTTVGCNTRHYRNWSFIFPRRPWLLIAINFLRE